VSAVTLRIEATIPTGSTLSHSGNRLRCTSPFCDSCTKLWQLRAKIKTLGQLHPDAEDDTSRLGSQRASLRLALTPDRTIFPALQRLCTLAHLCTSPCSSSASTLCPSLQRARSCWRAGSLARLFQSRSNLAIASRLQGQSPITPAGYRTGPKSRSTTACSWARAPWCRHPTANQRRLRFRLRFRS